MAEGFARQRKYEFQHRKRPVKRPACHPQLKHKAKGLCAACYAKATTPKVADAERRKHNAACHPDRKMIAGGLCKSCYMTFWWLHRLYKMTRDEFYELVERQGGACAICGEEPTPPKRLTVDHDHATGRFRGLLCGGCNAGLGNLQDEPELLESALRYLNA